MASPHLTWLRVNATVQLSLRACSPRCYTLYICIPTPRVRELRHSPTEAEEAAWYLLRDRRRGAKFRHQCRIENWVVDFYCFEHRWQSSWMVAFTRSRVKWGEAPQNKGTSEPSLCCEFNYVVSFSFVFRFFLHFSCCFLGNSKIFRGRALRGTLHALD